MLAVARTFHHLQRGLNMMNALAGLMALLGSMLHSPSTIPPAISSLLFVEQPVYCGTGPDTGARNIPVDLNLFSIIDPTITTTCNRLGGILSPADVRRLLAEKKRGI